MVQKLTDVHTSRQRSYNMSKIRGSNTIPEKNLRSLLWKRGFRYTLSSRLYGKPDIVFPRYKTVVFVDGCFWHGCPRHFVQPRSNKNFWKEKIKKNKKRDKEVSRKLKQQGWKVVRIWEHELRKSEEKTISKIQKKIISTKKTLQ